MNDKSKDMAKNLIEQLWCKYTNKLFKYFDYDWMALQALYSRYIIKNRN